MDYLSVNITNAIRQQINATLTLTVSFSNRTCQVRRKANGEFHSIFPFHYFKSRSACSFPLFLSIFVYKYISISQTTHQQQQIPFHFSYYSFNLSFSFSLSVCFIVWQPIRVADRFLVSESEFSTRSGTPTLYLLLSQSYLGMIFFPQFIIIGSNCSSVIVIYSVFADFICLISHISMCLVDLQYNKQYY